jgi:hypothetical protein
MKFKRNTNKSAAIKNEMNDDEVQSDSSDGSMPKSELRAAQLLLSIQNHHGQQRKVSGGKTHYFNDDELHILSFAEGSET